MANNNKKSLPIFDKKVFDASADYEFQKNPFIIPKLREFIGLKAKQHGVSEKMMLPSFLVATSNLMGKAEFRFTEDWPVQQNIFVLCVAPKGSGKTPSCKIFLDPVYAIESEEKAEYDAQKKRKREDDDTEDTKEDDYGKKFHQKTRLIETVTPEALTCTLAYGSSCLLIKADEFFGFHNKCIEKADNTSAICSAFTGEEIRNSTIARGEIGVKDSRVTIFGCIQPEPYWSLLNKPGEEDHQGLWDRFLPIPGTTDPQHVFDDYLTRIPEEQKVDIALYMRTVRDNHQTERTYRPTEEAMEKFKECHAELGELEEKSDYG